MNLGQRSRTMNSTWRWPAAFAAWRPRRGPSEGHWRSHTPGRFTSCVELRMKPSQRSHFITRFAASKTSVFSTPQLGPKFLRNLRHNPWTRPLAFRSPARTNEICRGAFNPHSNRGFPSMKPGTIPKSTPLAPEPTGQDQLDPLSPAQRQFARLLGQILAKLWERGESAEISTGRPFNQE